MISEEKLNFQGLIFLKIKIKLLTNTSFFIIYQFNLTSMTTVQDTQTFEGVYDGYEDNGFNFIGIDEDDDKYTMTF